MIILADFRRREDISFYLPWVGLEPPLDSVVVFGEVERLVNQDIVAISVQAEGLTFLPGNRGDTAHDRALIAIATGIGNRRTLNITGPVRH